MKRISSVTQKGQVTIPQVVREKLGIKYGDKVAFSFNEEGQVIIDRVSTDLDELYGILSDKKSSTPLEEERKLSREWIGEQKGRE
ncbi:AbrB/MazE/SpoVT family DNA-binding domain-containing protein [Dethiobacter alkaliphilus]|uniref:AbrB/MazE/SpoVT family DNA-binding domain-containing protein n=1 Tax=Dethiobacter alkaliphilus TaxID=427926 RepID=UPI002226EE5D|nr:type II toxin-antitoxin system PrlF family antitoxin [Dethiobacter alkaliphilus]MCW3489939.1 type II toxin-antitoxin system PrlF family antitoxin [Dethiobacter alkaliphilus]